MRQPTLPRFPEARICLRLVSPDAVAARRGGVEVPPLSHTFATMEGMLALVDAMATAGVLPEFTDGAGELLGRFTASVRVTELGRLVPIARAATFGVTRRITRESHDSAVVIDSIARLFSAALDQRPGGLDVVVPGFERWDRPSVRTLYRCCLLGGGRLRVQAVIVPATAGSSVDEHRNRWLRRFATLPGVDASQVRWDAGPDAAAQVDAEEVWDRLYEESFDTAMTELGNALAYQNFERTFLLLDAAHRRRLPVHERVEVERVRAVSEAQIGDIDTAMARLDAARRDCADPLARAHLSYLVGLLYTKRQFACESAERYYRDGLALLDGHPASEGAVVERSWLRNGLALSCTLRAREAEGESCDRLIAEAFALCFAALREVRSYSGEAALYLRYNLIANVTFLLEITDRPAEAVRFWRGAFSGLLESGSQQFAAAYWSRLGQLLAKAGDAEAYAAFAQALEACRQTGDLFYRERVHAGWAHAAWRGDDMETAADQYRAGARLAGELRDRPAYLSHLAGLAHCLAALGRTAALAELVRAVPDWPAELTRELARAGDAVSARETLERHEVVPRPPSPKLPPYIPGVDLEGDGTQDLNRMLVTKPAALARRVAG